MKGRSPMATPPDAMLRLRYRVREAIEAAKPGRLESFEASEVEVVEYALCRNVRQLPLGDRAPQTVPQPLRVYGVPLVRSDGHPWVWWERPCECGRTRFMVVK